MRKMTIKQLDEGFLVDIYDDDGDLQEIGCTDADDLMERLAEIFQPEAVETYDPWQKQTPHAHRYAQPAAVTPKDDEDIGGIEIKSVWLEKLTVETQDDDAHELEDESNDDDGRDDGAGPAAAAGIDGDPGADDDAGDAVADQPPEESAAGVREKEGLVEPPDTYSLDKIDQATLDEQVMAHIRAMWAERDDPNEPVKVLHLQLARKLNHLEPTISWSLERLAMNRRISRQVYGRSSLVREHSDDLEEKENGADNDIAADGDGGDIGAADPAADGGIEEVTPPPEAEPEDEDDDALLRVEQLHEFLTRAANNAGGPFALPDDTIATKMNCLRGDVMVARLWLVKRGAIAVNRSSRTPVYTVLKKYKP